MRRKDLSNSNIRTKETPRSTCKISVSYSGTAEDQTEILALFDTEQPIQVSSEPTLMCVPTPGVRIAIKPKLRQSQSPPPSPPSVTPVAEIRVENVTKQLLEAEPELKIIEKFTSFADVKSSGEPHYAIHQDDLDQDQEDLIERINQNTQRSFTDSRELMDTEHHVPRDSEHWNA